MNNHIDFEWLTDKKPTLDEICDEQTARSYHPLGYGGPYGVRFEEVTINNKKQWKTKWWCSGSAD